MKKMTMEDLRKRITYHQEGDFMVPDIGLPEEEEDEPELRKYGMMRKKYLEENQFLLYENGDERDPVSRNEEGGRSSRPDQEADVTETGSGSRSNGRAETDRSVEWVRRMEACNHQVEEVILAELVYS